MEWFFQSQFKLLQKLQSLLWKHGVLPKITREVSQSLFFNKVFEKEKKLSLCELNKYWKSKTK